MIFRSICLITLLLAVLLLPLAVKADEMADIYRDVKPFFDRLNNPTTIAGDSVAIIKCGTPYVLQAMSLSPEYRNALGITEPAVDRAYDAELTEYFDSPGGHFRVHFTTADTSRHVINKSYGDQNSNGVPDYAEIVARIADSVWAHHIDHLGFHEPPNDSLQSFGGGPRYDIYLINMGLGLYGYTQPENPAILDGSHVRATSWLALANHYETLPGYSQRPIEALQVTMAHEFFHAIQFWYDALEACYDAGCTEAKQNPYWMEMSAVWMEEDTYDGVNDYYGYLPSYFPYVHRSLRTFATSPMGDWSTLYCYGAGVFPLYLSEHFGKDIIRRIWEHCGEVSGPNFLEGSLSQALDEVTAGEIDLAQAWSEYGRWLFFTGTRARAGMFSEGSEYPMVPSEKEESGQTAPYIRTYSTYPIKPNETGDYRFFPDCFGFNYLDFRTASLDSVLTFGFSGVSDNQGLYDWRIGVMAYDRDNLSVSLWKDEELHENKDTFEVKNFDAYSDIVIIPTLVNPALTRLNNNYRFSVDDTSIVTRYNQISYGPSKLILSDDDNLNDSLRVTFKAAEKSPASIRVFTVGGEMVYSLETEVATNDELRRYWGCHNQDGEAVASGIYVVRAELGSTNKTFKVLVIR